jgi:hypothetical protein
MQNEALKSFLIFLLYLLLCSSAVWRTYACNSVQVDNFSTQEYVTNEMMAISAATSSVAIV